VRCALEEIGREYETIDIAPYDRSQPPEFEHVNPWRSACRPERRLPTTR